MGATCFMGSVLQVLLHTDLLDHAINRKDIHTCTKTSMEINDGQKVNFTKGCILCELRQLFQEAKFMLPAPDSANNNNIPSAVLVENGNIAESADIESVISNDMSLIPAYLLYRYVYIIIFHIL